MKVEFKAQGDPVWINPNVYDPATGLYTSELELDLGDKGTVYVRMVGSHQFTQEQIDRWSSLKYDLVDAVVNVEPLQIDTKE